MESSETILQIKDLSAPELGRRLESFGYKIQRISHPDAYVPSDSFSGPPKIGFIAITGESLDEIAELVKAQKAKTPEIQLIALRPDSNDISSRALFKLGVDYSFQIPREEELLLNTVFEAAPVDIPDKLLSFETMVRVGIVNLEGDDPLPFDTYVCLPANKKVLKFRTKGHALEQKTIEKFKKLPKYSLYIKKSDLKLYHSYSANVLSEIQAAEDLDAEQKTKQINKEINQLMEGFFDEEPLSDEDQQQTVENVRKIVEQLKDESGSKEEQKKSAFQLASEHITNYSHSRNVATFCSLFGMVLGYNEPETLGMGGLLHDIGLSDLSPNLVGKELADMEDDEAAQYKLHPGNARFNIKEKKMELPEKVILMIVEHHENTDGSGYPYGIKGNEIDPYAKICAFADKFDKLTSLREGYKQMTPAEAVHRIAGLDGKPPLGIYDPDFHQPLVNFVLSESKDEDPSLENDKITIKTSDAAAVDSEEIAVPGAGINSNPDSEKIEVSGAGLDSNPDSEKITVSGAGVDSSPDSEKITVSAGSLDAGASLNDTSDETAKVADSVDQTATDKMGLEDTDQSVEMDSDLVSGVSIDDLKSEVQELEEQKASGKKNKPGQPGNKKKSKIDVKARNKKGQTILMQFSALNKLDIVQLLIQLGAEVDAKDFNGHTGLMFAARLGHIEVCKLLIEHRANANAKDGRGRTALVHAVETGKASVVDLMLEAGSRADYRLKGVTPLMMAAIFGHKVIVEALLDAGADKKARDPKGNTVIEYALSGGHDELAKSLGYQKPSSK